MSEPHAKGRAEEWIAEARNLRRLAAHLVTDPAAADDLVQDTWVAAMRANPDGDRPLGAWLAQVLRNFARKRQRGDVRRADRELYAFEAREVAAPDHIAERLDSQRVLIEVVRGLAEPLRTTVVLRYFEDRPSAQIARMQRIPEGTVRWRLKRALDELRVELDARFGGSRSSWCALFAPLAVPSPVPNSPAASTPPSTAIAVTTEGALAVGTMTKISVALAALLLGGFALWSVEGDESPAIASTAFVSDAAAAMSEPRASGIELVALDAANAEPTRRADSTSSAAEPVRAPAPARSDIVEQFVEVRFLAANGVPWQGVRFWRVSQEEDAVLSGADGRARLRMLRRDPPGSLHMDFVATHAGCATASLGATVHSGETTHLGDVVLVGSLVIRGRVVDDDGRGVGKAEVGLSAVKLSDPDLEFIHRQGSRSFDRGATVVSASDGFFTLRGVAPGEWRLWAKAPKTRYGWTAPFEAVSDEMQGFEVVLAPLRASDRLVGRVVDPKGDAVPNAELVMSYSLKVESATVSEQADDEGRFDFVVWRDCSYTVLAWDADHRWAEGALENVTPGAGELVVQLAEPTTMEVRVHDPSGNPLEGCEISVQRTDPNRSPEAHLRVLDRGRYQIALPAYACSVNVKATGHRPRSFGPFPVRAAPPKLDVELAPLPVVTGTVIADGRPLAGVRVGLHAGVTSMLNVDGFDCLMERAPRESALTDANGRFTIGCDVGGEFYVRADADGFAAGEHGPLSVSSIGRPIEIELTRGGAIEGRVLLEGGASGEGAIVGINRGDGRARTGRAGAGGVYRFEGLTPGRWQVLLRGEEVRPDRSISFVDDELPAHPIEWSCEVVARKTTTFDVVAEEE